MKAACLKCFSGLLGLAIAASCGGAAEAATLILGASNQSRYDSFGIDFLATNTDSEPLGNTLTGWRNGIEFRSYFVFDLASVTSAVTGARLRLLNKRYYSTETSETIQLFDVTTPATDLVGGFLQPQIFEDLGTGVSYGETTLVANPPANDFDNAVLEYFEVVLTQAAIDGINRAVAEGQRYFGIGIKLEGTQPDSPYVFDCRDPATGEIISGCGLAGLEVEGVLFSGGNRDPLQDSEAPGELILDFQSTTPPIGVPEPAAALSLVAVGLIGTLLKSNSQRSN